MQLIAQLIALAVLAIVAAVALTLAWSTARWALRTRRVVAFRTVVQDVAGRADGIIAGISERIDSVRRGSLAAAQILPDLAEAQAATAALATEARALTGPLGSAAILAGIVQELERSGRALEMVEHGCRVMSESRGRDQDPEAQTAVKRGYLSLVHAREYIAEHDGSAARLLADMPRLRGGRPAR